MQPKIINLSSKKLVGKSLSMSLKNDRPRELWSGFMPERNKINNTLGSQLFSIQIYDESLDFKDFNSQIEFTKAAMVEVSEFETIPKEMEQRILTGDLYAVFIHKGTAASFSKTAQYIFGQWLPNSDYELDKRAHFELLEPAYNPVDENSEEEVWIPIKVEKTNVG